MPLRILARRGAVAVAGTFATIALSGCGSTAKPNAAPVVTVAAKPPPTFADAVAKVRSGIVRIETTKCDGGVFGTGFLLSSRLVATVEHVVAGARTVTLKQNGKIVAHGTVIGSDVARDLALIRTDRSLTGHHLTLSSRSPQLAETVEAIGFPLGLPMSATGGSVSGLDRTVEIDGVRRRNMVQTDAAVNPGNSGGPLLTINGQVVGLVDLLRLDANGIGYAVSAAVAKPLLTAWQAAPQPVSAATCAPSSPPSSQAAGAPPPSASVPPSTPPAVDTFSGSGFTIMYPSEFSVITAEVNKGSYYDTTLRYGDDLIRIDENPTGATGDLDQDAAPVIDGLRRETGYRELSLVHTTFQGYDALRWEFEVPEGGVLLHKVDTFFVGDTGAEWAVLTQSPASVWNRIEGVFDEVDNTFAETR